MISVGKLKEIGINLLINTIIEFIFLLKKYNYFLFFKVKESLARLAGSGVPLIQWTSN